MSKQAEQSDTRRWEREGAYWSDRIPNFWGQPGVTFVELEVAEGARGLARGLGVAIDTFMCETFLTPEDALAFARRVRRCALTAIRAGCRA